VSTRTHTQEDPIGLAGGLNLYGFAGGDPINFWDPFGLSPQDDAEKQLEQMHKAAFKALDEYNPYSVAENREYAGLIYRTTAGKIGSTPAVQGPQCTAGASCGISPFAAIEALPRGADILGEYHTHGADDPGDPGNWEDFSEGDIHRSNNRGISTYRGMYLGTPGGKAYFYRAGSMPAYRREELYKVIIPIGTIRTRH
jgi:hypothetical protein